MSDYLLMRNNKQSGPHSLGELLQIGFKPYDLIWVEGKSAMWRYPSEVPELKEYAVAIEEQLYDQVFPKKKMDDQRKPAEDNLPPKRVFVTMPDKPAASVPVPPVSRPETITPVHQQTRTLHTTTDNKPVADIKFSQPLDDIKERYSKNLRDKKQLIAQQLYMFRNLKKVFVYLGFIAIGVFAGYLIYASKKNTTAAVNKSETKSPETMTIATNQDVQKINDPVVSEDINTTTEGYPHSATLNEETKKGIKNLNNEKKNENQAAITSKDKEPDQNVKNSNKSEQSSPGVDLNQATGERNKKTRGETNESGTSSASIEDEIKGQVLVSNNDYQRAAFGGIRNLELTVTNHSKYFLDKVIVELQYIKPNELPLRSENIVFNSVPSQGTLTIAIPPSNRGIKVAYKITRVESKELGSGTAGLQPD